MVLFYNAPTKSAPKSKKQSAAIESLDYQGLGIAKVAGKTWFIENALPNETVEFVVLEEKRQYGRGKAIKWQNSSPSRRKPQCPWYGQCGGCQMQHIAIEAQRDAKQQALLHPLHKIEKELMLAPMIAGAEWGYRRRVRLSLQYLPANKSVVLGFRQAQSNQLVPITECPILVAPLSQLLPDLTKLFQSWQYPKKLGHIELVAADNGVALLLRHLGDLALKDENLLRQFAQDHHLMLFVSTAEQQIEDWTLSQPYYQMEQFKLQFDVRDFIQVNAMINQQMVQTAIDWLDISKQDRVLDLFCGMGNFSLSLADKAGYVVGIEGVTDMVEKAKANAQRNHLNNLYFYQTDLAASFTEQAWAAEKFNKVLLDPPRAGALFALPHIIELQPEKILYVSCNPATLVRDLQVLVAKAYRLRKSAMIDMFPQTGHLESIHLLERV